MAYEIKMGDILYYFSGYSEKIRECTVLDMDKDKITVRFHEPEQQDKSYLSNFIGKKLFRDISHIENSYEKFSSAEVYGLYKEHIDEKFLSKRNEIKEVLKNKKIKDIVHFTRLENLKSILDKGIVPQINQRQRSITAVINDISRNDYRPDCTSFSITFPNDKNFKRFREKNPEKEWTIIILDPEVLLSQENPCEFCLTNAATRYMRAYSGSDAEHLKNMFKQEFVVQKQNGVNYMCQRQNLPDNFTTDVQAEVLIEGVIDKKYIKKIIFNSVTSKENWCNQHHDIVKNYQFEVLPEYFGLREDFIIKRGLHGCPEVFCCKNR